MTMRRQTIVILAAALVMVGCAWLSVAEYDPALAHGVAGLQKKVDTFLAGLGECAGTPEGEYDRHASFYAEARQELAGLGQLARVQPGNDLTVRSLDSLAENLDQLEAMHRAGITSADEVALIAGLFDTQFRMLLELENAKKTEEQ